MKIAFFANPVDGRYAGFCRWNAAGRYVGMQSEDDGGRLVDDIVIDVAECRTFNDAKRHGNMLAGFDPEDGVSHDGDFVMTACPSTETS